MRAPRRPTLYLPYPCGPPKQPTLYRRPTTDTQPARHQPPSRPPYTSHAGISPRPPPPLTKRPGYHGRQHTTPRSSSLFLSLISFRPGTIILPEFVSHPKYLLAYPIPQPDTYPRPRWAACPLYIQLPEGAPNSNQTGVRPSTFLGGKARPARRDTSLPTLYLLPQVAYPIPHEAPSLPCTQANPRHPS